MREVLIWLTASVSDGVKEGGALLEQAATYPGSVRERQLAGAMVQVYGLDKVVENNQVIGPEKLLTPTVSNTNTIDTIMSGKSPFTSKLKTRRAVSLTDVATWLRMYALVSEFMRKPWLTSLLNQLSNHLGRLRMYEGTWWW